MLGIITECHALQELWIATAYKERNIAFKTKTQNTTTNKNPHRLKVLTHQQPQRNLLQSTVTLGITPIRAEVAGPVKLKA